MTQFIGKNIENLFGKIVVINTAIDTTGNWFEIKRQQDQNISPMENHFLRQIAYFTPPGGGNY